MSFKPYGTRLLMTGNRLAWLADLAGAHSGLSALHEALRQAWSADTSFCPNDWSPANASLGQCAVTALIVQDAFGGELLRGGYRDGSHYWNRLPCGKEVDLTADQFGVRPNFDATEVRTREYVLSFSETYARYSQLRRRVGKRLEAQPDRLAVV